MSDHIEITREGAVSVIRMNRADKKNALTRAMYAEMTAELMRADADPETRAIVFFGVPGAFSAGNDMADFMAYAEGGKLGHEVLDFLHALERGQTPLVAGVDGLAIGIGTTLVMHCDAAIASDHSLFRTPFVDLGLVPEAGSSLLGPALLGYQTAFAMLVLGEDFSAEDAKAAGLVRRVTDQAALEHETLALARRIAEKPPEALRLSRGLLRDRSSDLAARIDAEAKLFAERLMSDETRAALMAFMMRKRA